MRLCIIALLAASSFLYADPPATPDNPPSAPTSAPATPAADPTAVTEANIQRAIDRGVEYLYSQANKDGVWDQAPAPFPVVAGQKPLNMPPLDGGQTALVLNALASAGQADD